MKKTIELIDCYIEFWCMNLKDENAKLSTKNVAPLLKDKLVALP
jgi:hypothetical protein